MNCYSLLHLLILLCVCFFLFCCCPANCPQGSKVIDQLDGADAAALTAKVTKLAATGPAAAPQAAAQQPVDVTTRIKSLLKNPVVLFMKGSAASPYCGFSRKVVDALRGAGANTFVDVDILKDEELR